jgi:hypothetical protein
MAATEAQILNQINVNYDAMDKLLNNPVWKTGQLNSRYKFLWDSQQYWAREYFKTTGKSIALINPGYMMLTDSLAEEKQEADTAKLQAARKKQVEDAIYLVKQEYQRICLALQSQYDISVEFQNAMFSHWTRMGGGLHAKHPLYTKKQIEETAWPLILEAEKLYQAGKYVKAYEKAAAAARRVKWGFDFLDWWMSKLETGAERAIVGIKVSAALATLIVTGPAEVGVLGTMALAGTSEAAQQGTTLIAQGVDPGMSVSLDDVKNAALAVAVNAGTAGLGKGLGNLVAKGVAPKAAEALIKNSPAFKAATEVERKAMLEAMTSRLADFFGPRIEQYVSANAQSIANKMLKLDKSPDWNWWYMVVAPAINASTMEMAKEPDLQKLLTK